MTTFAGQAYFFAMIVRLFDHSHASILIGTPSPFPGVHMSQAQSNSITCPFCNRQYNWKPDLAGRRVKCKCGNLITVPEVSPVEQQPADNTYDVGEVDLSDL